MNSIQSLLKNQDFIAGTALNCPIDDKTALRCEKNINQRLFRITGKQRGRSRPIHQDPYKVEKILRQFTPAEKEVTSSLIVLSRLFSRITTSAQTLAQQAGYCSKTVYRTYSKLTQLGLIKRKRRYNNSSITMVNPILEHPVLKSRLWTLFDAYTYFKRQAPRYLLLYLLFSHNVPLEYSNRFKSTNQYHSRDDRMPQSIPQPRSVSRMTPDLHQKTKILEQSMHSPISEILQKEVTTTLGLTKKGQIHLCAFPDAAFSHALDEFKFLKCGDRDFDFKLFFNLCVNYLKDHNLGFDFDKVQRLLNQHAVRQDAPYYYPQPKETVAPQKGNGIAQLDAFAESMFGAELAALASKIKKRP